tara:strand:- start:515 stop:619 length:105 start_codon:yes stop_codon:yes gene_type:complete
LALVAAAVVVRQVTVHRLVPIKMVNQHQLTVTKA